ncbi:hypothetical protein HPP92_015122 [Vanilla planifolia]|uniref:Protein transport protein SEC23 n=1 Tax=Vanilla planifolia TaxID=51239 RepID=A0A835UXJ4_VANPL|nr:hypothetical protein HPP92_015122 [Vanilla planifolia]
MDNSPPPHPLGFSPSRSSSSTMVSSPDNRLNLPPFSSPVSARFSPQNSLPDQLPLSSSISTSSLTSGGGASNGSPLTQFSTPPGPPVFSSPLRPAAIPFQTLPSSPQPVAFSSDSTLPIHSPSTHLPLQHTASVEETIESPYVLFSAHKVLKRKKQANISSLGFGALVSPGREVNPGPQVVQRDPHRCHNCGAYANLYSDVLIGSGQWQCVICKKLNSSDGEYIAASKNDLHHWPEFSSSAIDYVQSGNRRPGYVPVSDSRMSAPIFLVIDECLDEAHLQHLQGSLHAFVDSLPQNMRIGIITYGRTVSIYDFSEGSVATAGVLPGASSPSEDALKTLIYGTGIYLSAVHASLPVAHTIFSSMRPYKLNLPEASRDRCLGAAVEVALAIINGPSAEMSRGIIKRPGGNCRILVCAGGPNTFGPGSVPSSFSHPNYPYMEKTAMKWMENLGQTAHRNNVIIDVLCAGTCPVRVPVLQPLAKCSGGTLLLHDDFGEAFGVNLKRASMALRFTWAVRDSLFR